MVVAADPLVADQSHVDRGDVRVGPPLVQQFRLTNRVNETVTITNVTSTCGCLAPKSDARELAPGTSTNLTIEINTLSQPAGPVNWVTRVSYRTGAQNHELVLDVRAKLIAEVRVEPASVAFSIRQSRSVELQVTDSRAKPFRITAVGSSSPQLKAELLASDKPNKCSIRITASAGGDPGVSSAVAWFTTDDPLYPQIIVPVTLTIPQRRRVVASPSTLDIDRGSSARVQLRDQEGKKLVIDRIEVEGPLTASVLSTTEFIATINVKCLSKLDQRDGTIIIHMREPVVERVTIPVIIR